MSAPDVRAAFAAALLDPSRPPPAGVSARRREAAASRFAVHRNTVSTGLSRALAARFPVVEALVGEAFFKAMAAAFVATHPPRSPVLLAWGDDLPAFVEDFPPAAAVPYLTDVARVEVAVARAFHAADDPALPAAALGRIPPDRLERAHLVPHPAMALVRSPWPAGSIWSAHRAAGSPAPPTAWTAEAVLVTRPGPEVRLAVIPEADAAFLAALAAGADLAAAAVAALDMDPRFDPGRALVGAAAAGAFAAVHLAEETAS